ncbi:MAG: hypothetical protein KC420_11515, partial [Myxococcales bacterium]|nr:hypothetical protein [Myxococcales bacterium]
ITLYLEGHVELSEGSAEPFTIAATSASGILVDLADALAQPNGAGTHASVVVTRDLARAFDGIDFVNDDPAELDRAVLRNLVQGSSVEIRLSAGSE